MGSAEPIEIVSWSAQSFGKGGNVDGDAIAAIGQPSELVNATATCRGSDGHVIGVVQNSIRTSEAKSHLNAADSQFGGLLLPVVVDIVPNTVTDRETATIAEIDGGVGFFGKQGGLRNVGGRNAIGIIRGQAKRVWSGKTHFK
jgi:hypothetical protein